MHSLNKFSESIKTNFQSRNKAIFYFICLKNLIINVRYHFIKLKLSLPHKRKYMKIIKIRFCSFVYNLDFNPIKVFRCDFLIKFNKTKKISKINFFTIEKKDNFLPISFKRICSSVNLLMGKKVSLKKLMDGEKKIK